MSRWHTIQNLSIPLENIVAVGISQSTKSCWHLTVSYESKDHVPTCKNWSFSGADVVQRATNERDKLLRAMDDWEKAQRQLVVPAPAPVYNPTIIYAVGARKRKRRGSF
jgi:hypothetical protein